MKNRRRSRLISFLIIIFVLVLTQRACASAKVDPISADAYSLVYELKVTPKWRYGFLWDHHGAWLVKTENVEEAVPLDSCIGWDGLCNELLEEINLIPLKTILELCLYGVILVYMFWVVPWQRTKFAFLQDSVGKEILVETVLWILGWTILLLPLLLFDYGQSLYTNWIGPGAASWSGMYYEVSGAQGVTISYRTWLEIIMLLPIKIMDAIGLLEYLYGMQVKWFIWVVGMLSFGFTGFIIGSVRVMLRSVRVKIQSKNILSD